MKSGSVEQWAEALALVRGETEDPDDFQARVLNAVRDHVGGERAANADPGAWTRSAEGIDAMGRKLGIAQRLGESKARYGGRLLQALSQRRLAA